MRITSAGLVGIGTSSPAFTLDVQAPLATLKLASTTGTNPAYMFVQNGGGDFYLGRDNSTGTTFSTGTGYSAVLYSSNAFPMVFFTNAIERMRITSVGSVGIGVIPSGWSGNGVRAIQAGNGSLWNFAGAGNIFLGANYYFDGSVRKYISNAGVAEYLVNEDGTHIWYNAPSGTANATVSLAERMRIDSSGNLMVGTTSSSVKFRVQGASVDLGEGETNTLQSIYSTTAQAAGVGSAILLGGTFAGAGSLAGYASVSGIKENSTSGNTASAFTVKTRANGGNLTERMRIDSAGNVGIGTSSPSFISGYGGVQINGAGNGSVLHLTNSFTGTTSTDGFDLILVQGSADAYVWQRESAPLVFGTAATERMRIASTGSVLIGTATGTSLLSFGANVPANGQTINVYESGNTRSGIGVVSAVYRNYTSSDASLSFGHVSNSDGSTYTERMRIDSSGRLGLGITPSAWGSNYSVEDVGSFGAIASLNTLNQFHVTCNSYNDNTNWKFKTTNASLRYALQNDQHEWYYSASGSANSNITYTQVMLLTAGGNLTISGATATKASGTTWANPSDVRLKENITNFTKGLNELLQINVKKWEYNGKGNTVAGTKGLGVIADEIMQVLPETVDTYKAKLNSDDKEKTDIKRFDATEITWLLVNAVKEQQTLINNLTTRLNALEGK
jgi:hypothetical protein